MGGGKTSDGHLSSESSSSSSSSSSDFEGPPDPPSRAYLNILRLYGNPPEITLILEQYKDAILRHKVGDWISRSSGGLTAKDYEVPEVTSLLLVGAKGSGNSTLVNRIARVFEYKFAPVWIKCLINH